jgi:hypothetical protein
LANSQKISGLGWIVRFQGAARPMLTYITFGLISLLAGMVLGQRFKVLALVPAFAVSLVLAVGFGIAHFEQLGGTVLLAALAVASLQIGYLVGVAIRYSLAATRTSGLRTASIHASQPTRHAAR